MNKHTVLPLAGSLLGAALLLGPAASQAGTLPPVPLTLGAEHTGAYIENYFAGGADSVPSDGDGPNLGYTFSNNATVQKAGSNAATGDGRFENNPSGQTEILYFAADSSNGTLNTGGSYLNFAGGFSSIAFNYAMSGNSTADDATAELWSGANGTGTLLGTIALTSNGAASACTNHGDAYCNWYSTGTVSDFGSDNATAYSITFGAAATTDLTEFDGVQVSPVPLPAAAWLLLTGLGGLGALGRRRAAA